MSFNDPSVFDWANVGRNANPSPVSDQERARINQGTQQVPPALSTVFGTEPAKEATNRFTPSTGGAGTNVTNPSIANTGAAQVGVDPFVALTNPLHAYPSYTYALSLISLTTDEYNEVIENNSLTNKRVLIASAGRHNQTDFKRSPRFGQDFYFDDFKMNCVVTPTESSRNTNMIGAEFKIIEPYGMTLVERLMLEARDLGIQNHLEAPYLLEIAFFAYDEQGTPVGQLLDHTKYIPIKIKDMKINLTSRGAEYTVNVVPYHHRAFNFKYVSTPHSIEVRAKTIAGFFDTGATAAENQQTQVRENRAVNGSISGDRPPTGQITAESFAAALNAYEQSLVDLNQYKVANIYKFVFDPEIADASITFEERVNHLDTGFTDVDNPQEISKMATGNLGRAVGLFDPSRQVYTINAGTSIERVIDYMVRNSNYILKQLRIPENYSSAEAYQAAIKENNGFLNWYKITPKTKLLDFDPNRGVYAREITYYVSKYIIKNVPLDFAPSGIETNPVKVYNYFYTGKNVDVLNLDINFNMLYFKGKTVYKNAMTQTLPTPKTDQDDSGKVVEGYDGAATQPGEIDASELMPKVYHPMINDARTRATGSVLYSAQVAASELERYVLAVPGTGEMIDIKLDIIGDPHFIKQDDLFYISKPNNLENNEQNPGSTDDRLTVNGSIKTDKNTVYVRVDFQVPVDYRESDGLMTFSSQEFTRSIFSGVYYLKETITTMSQGQFKQTLVLVRAWNQQETIRTTLDNQTASSSDNRTSGPTTFSPPAPTVVNAPATSSAGSSAPDPTTPDSLPAPPDESPVRDNTARLQQVNNTAPTQPITDQNQPTPVAPPSTNPNDTDNLISGIVNNTQTRLSSSDPRVKLNAVEDSADKYRALQTIYENQGDFARASIARQEFEAQLQQRAQLRRELGL